MEPLKHASVWADVLARLDGRPTWVLDLLDYACSVLRRRDRINLYDAARRLSSASSGGTAIGASEIREELEAICAPDHLEWTGRFRHRVSISERVVSFWRDILLPASRRPQPWDLSIAVALMDQETLRSIMNDPTLRGFLPPRSRSLPKAACVSHVVRESHRSPDAHGRFCRQRLAGRVGLQRLLDLIGEQPRLELREADQEETRAFAELMCLAVARPQIRCEREVLGIGISRTARFEEARRLETVQASSLPLTSCINHAIQEIAEALDGPGLPRLPPIQQTLVHRQLSLMAEREKDTPAVLELVRWLLGVNPAGAIALQQLPGDLRCELWEGSRSGCFAPFVLSGASAAHLAEIAHRYGLVSLDSETGTISTSDLGRVAVGLSSRSSLAKLTWGRNVERLTIRTIGALPEEALNILRCVARESGQGEYVITPTDLVSRGLDEQDILLALSAFSPLNTKNLRRLRGWVGVDKRASVHLSAVLPKADIPPGVEVAELVGGLSKDFQETGECQVLFDIRPEDAMRSPADSRRQK